MCLAVPGKVVRWIDQDPLFATAQVEFGGIERACNMSCVSTAQVGDYVIVHAGIAIAIIDQAAATRLLTELEDVLPPADLRNDRKR